MAFLTEATPAHELGSVKDPLPSKTTMLPLSITPDTTSKGLRTLAPWNVTQLEMSPSPCRPVMTFTVNSPRLSIFSPPGPTFRCPFTEPFDGFRSTSGKSSGFTTDSPAPESPEFCPTDTLCRETGQHALAEWSLGAASTGISSGRPSPTLEMSLYLVNVGTHPTSDTKNKQGSSPKGNFFTLGTDFGAFRAQGSTCCQTSDCSCFQSQQSKNGDSSSRRPPLQGFRNFLQCIS